MIDSPELEQPLRYESCVVDDMGLLISPLDSLLYELSYKLTAFGSHTEQKLEDMDIIPLIKSTKIPKEDVLAAILSKPKLAIAYGEGTEVFKYLKSF